MLPKVQIDNVFSKSSAYARKMFTYSDLEGPSGPPNVLEATRAPQQVDHLYRIAGNKF